MWGFSCGGGELVGATGPVAQLDERVGLALRDRSGVGDAVVGGGAAGGELLDQGADHVAVLGVQPALQSQSPVPAVAQPQLPAYWCRGSGILVWLRFVGVEGGEHPVGDDAQPAGVEVTGVASQLNLGAFSCQLGD